MDFDTYVDNLEAKAQRDPITETDLQDLFTMTVPDSQQEGAARSVQAHGPPDSRFVEEPVWASIDADLTEGEADGEGSAVPAVRGPLVTAHVLRRLMAGVPTAAETELEASEIDEVFRDLGVGSDLDWVNSFDFVAMLGGGFMPIYPDAVDAPRAAPARSGGKLDARAQRLLDKAVELEAESQATRARQVGLRARRRER